MPQLGAGAGLPWAHRTRHRGFPAGRAFGWTCVISDPPCPVLVTHRPQGADHDLSACLQPGVQPTALLPTGGPAASLSGSLAGSPVLFRAGGEPAGAPGATCLSLTLPHSHRSCFWGAGMPAAAGQSAQDMRPLRMCPRPRLRQEGGGGQVCGHQRWHLDCGRFPGGPGRLRGRPSTCVS